MRSNQHNDSSAPPGVSRWSCEKIFEKFPLNFVRKLEAEIRIFYGYEQHEEENFVVGCIGCSSK